MCSSLLIPVIVNTQKDSSYSLHIRFSIIYLNLHLIFLSILTVAPKGKLLGEQPHDFYDSILCILGKLGPSFGTRRPGRLTTFFHPHGVLSNHSQNSLSWTS